jgi:hypothetical protein
LLALLPDASHEAVPWPATPTPLPHTVTGALTGALASPPPAALPPPDPEPAHEPEPLPTELPHTVTGAFTGALPFDAPPDTLPVPDAPHDDELLPFTPTELPHTFTGAFAGALRRGVAAAPRGRAAVVDVAALDRAEFGGCC